MLEVKFGVEDGGCLSCGSRVNSTAKVKINRDKDDRNIITFHLCRECLNKLAKEFQPFS